MEKDKQQRNSTREGDKILELAESDMKAGKDFQEVGERK